MRTLELSDEELVGIYAALATTLMTTNAIATMTKEERHSHMADVNRIEGWMAATDFMSKNPDASLRQMYSPIMRKIANMLAPEVE